MYGAVFVNGFRRHSASLLLHRFLCSTSKPVSSSRRALRSRRRAQGPSRLAVAPTFPHAAPWPGHTLTAPSPTARLTRSGTIRGELAIGRGSSRRNLVFGRSSGPDHDAVMRIGGEAPRRRTHSRNRCQHHGLLRVTATSDRHRMPTKFCSSGSESLSCLSSPFTRLATRRQLEPRQ